MISAEDYETYTQNEVLIDMINSLKTTEKNLREFVPISFHLNRTLSRVKDPGLLELGNAVNDELEETFDRYTDLKVNMQPKEFVSLFGGQARKEAKPVPRAVKAETKKETKKEAKKVEPEIRPGIFDLLDEPSATKPATTEPQENLLEPPSLKSGKENPIARLNEIMAKMQMREQEEKRQKKEEEKKSQDLIQAAFPSMGPIMNSGWMGFPPNMPVGFNPQFAPNQFYVPTTQPRPTPPFNVLKCLLFV